MAVSRSPRLGRRTSAPARASARSSAGHDRRAHDDPARLLHARCGRAWCASGSAAARAAPGAACRRRSPAARVARRRRARRPAAARRRCRAGSPRAPRSATPACTGGSGGPRCRRAAAGPGSTTRWRCASASTTGSNSRCVSPCECSSASGGPVPVSRYAIRAPSGWWYSRSFTARHSFPWGANVVTSPGVGVVSTLGQPVRRREDARLLSGRGEFLDDLRARGHAAHGVRALAARPRPRRASSAPGALRGPRPICGHGLAGADRAAARARRRAGPAPAARRRRGPLRRPAGRGGGGRVAGAGRGRSRSASRSTTSRWTRSSTRAPASRSCAGRSAPATWRGAFAAAAHVVRTETVIPRLAAVPMEPRGALAAPDGERLTVWTSSQSAHRPRAQLAQMPRPREDEHPRDRAGRRRRLRLQGHAAGRGAAGRARGAASSSGPVKWTEDRRENFLSAPQGRGMRAAVELALDADGRILAPARPAARRPRRLPAAEHADPAAHDRDAARRLLRHPERRGDRHRRAHEQGPDRALPRRRPPGGELPDRDGARRRRARARRSTRSTLRRRNLVREFPYTTALGWTYDSGDFERCLDRALELIGEPPPLARAGEHVVRPSRADAPVRPLQRAHRHRRRALGRALRRALRARRGHARRRGDVLVSVGSIPSRPGPRDPVRADRRRPARRRPRAGHGAHRRHRRDPGRRRLVREPLRPRWAARRSRRRATTCSRTGRTRGRARFESDQVFASGAYAATVEVERATGARQRQAARGRRRRRADHQPAAGRGPGDRRRGPGPRRVPDRGGRPRRAGPPGTLLDYSAADRRRDPARSRPSSWSRRRR